MSFPHHQISNQYLIKHFYSSLLASDWNTINTVAYDAFSNKTPSEASNLISTMAKNSQNFGNRATGVDFFFLSSKEVNELRSQLSNLTSLVIVKRASQQVMAYGVCGALGHLSDKCPKVIKEFNAVWGFNRNYDPYSNIYNARWRDHPHLRWGNKGQ